MLELIVISALGLAIAGGWLARRLPGRTGLDADPGSHVRVDGSSACACAGGGAADDGNDCGIEGSDGDGDGGGDGDGDGGGDGGD